MGRRRATPPVGLAHLPGLGQEIEIRAGVNLSLPLVARSQQFMPARIESPVQISDERQRRGTQD